MAASQDPNDNPVAINVVPMVDVIFCLCVFFMCSFHFKQIEGALRSWLPRDKGMGPGLAAGPEEVRVALEWDAQRAVAVRRLGNRAYADDREFEQALRETHAAAQRHGRSVPVIVDGAGACPWDAVVQVLNLTRRIGIGDVELAMAPPVRRR